jgi:large subunit ribosomal protein L25
MSETIEINAYPRELVGHANKRMARTGQIPAVVYGHDHATRVVAVDRHDFELIMSHHAAGATIVQIAIEGEKRPVNAVVKEVQRSPVKGTILHIDFQVIRMDEVIHVTVPLRFVGDSAGVKAGGILTESAHQLNIEAKPMDIPEAIEAEVADLEIGDSLRLGQIEAPRGVRFLDGPEEILCSVLPPAIQEVAEVAPAEEGEEPEVIGEKAAEEEAE